MNYKDIAIIGVACKLPLADSLQEFREKLISGADCIREIPRSRRKLLGLDMDGKYMEIGFLEEIENFDNKFFNISNKEAKQMSPEQRLSMEICAKTILDAGYSLENFKGQNCSVIISSSENTYSTLTGANDDGLGYLGSLQSMLCGKISYYFDLHGPSCMIDTGCSSSLAGIHYGCMNLICGQCDYSLVGGVSINLQFPKKDDVKERDILGIGSSSGRCFSFDAKADGAGVGEGVGFVLLKRYDEAIRDNDHIYAVIKGSHINSDGVRCNSITSPSVLGQEEVLNGAWQYVNAEEITDIEAHGTGTPIGDPIEITSLSEALEKNNVGTDKKVYVGSVKSNIGHLVSAAGVAGVIKTIIGYKYNERYPIAHFETPNPLINFSDTPLVPVIGYEKLEASAKRITGVSSFSLNGTNAHVLLENVIQDAEINTSMDAPNHIVKISAKSKSSIRNYAEQLKIFLDSGEYGNINDVIYTLNCGRDDYEYRECIIANDVKGLIASLSELEFEKPENSGFKVVYLITKDEELNPGTVSDIVSNYRLMREMGVNSDLILVDKAGRAIVDMDKNGLSIEELCDVLSGLPIKTDFEKVNNKLEELSSDSDVLLLNFGTQKMFAEKRDRIVELMCRSTEQVWLAVRKCYLSGKSIDWQKLYRNYNYKKTPTPTYCFDKLFHWMPIIKNAAAGTKRDKNKTVIVGTNLKEQIRQIWMNVLEQDVEISDGDDFFSLGGNSLLIASLLEEVNSFYSLNIKVDSIYDCAIFSDFCNMVADHLQEKNSH